MLKLYDYFRSSAAYRARIALNLKGLDYESLSIHLTKGVQFGADYAAVNPQMLVPALVDGDVTVAQSLAIMEYLDEVYPDKPLLPADPAGRARVRALAMTVACEIHPINNLRVRKYLVEDMGLSEDQRQIWMEHWIALGFAAIEARLTGDGQTGDFCHGDTPGMADVCLIPQVFNARGINCDLSPYPKLVEIDARCQEHPAFAAAHPSKQPDAE